MANKYLFFCGTLLFILVLDQVDGPAIPSQKDDLDKAVENMQGDNEKMQTYTDALKYEPKEQRQCQVPSILHGEPSRYVISPGETAVYSCHYGSTIEGKEKVTCLPNGSVTDVPKCETRICFPFMAHIQNGYLAQSGNQYEYRCNTGFYRRGKATVVIKDLKAHPDFDKFPVCLEEENKARNCSRLQNPQNGQVVQRNRTGAFQKAFFSCNEEFELLGISTTECTADGDWDMETFPVCVKQQKGSESCRYFAIAIAVLSMAFAAVLVIGFKYCAKIQPLQDEIERLKLIQSNNEQSESAQSDLEIEREEPSPILASVEVWVEDDDSPRARDGRHYEEESVGAPDTELMSLTSYISRDKNTTVTQF